MSEFGFFGCVDGLKAKEMSVVVLLSHLDPVTLWKQESNIRVPVSLLPVNSPLCHHPRWSLILHDRNITRGPHFWFKGLVLSSELLFSFHTCQAHLKSDLYNSAFYCWEGYKGDSVYQTTPKQIWTWSHNRGKKKRKSYFFCHWSGKIQQVSFLSEEKILNVVVFTSATHKHLQRLIWKKIILCPQSGNHFWQARSCQVRANITFAITELY